VPQCTHTHAHKKKHTHIHTVSNILLVLLSQYQHHNIIISALRHCYCYCYCSYCCFCCRQHTHAHNTHTAQTEHLTNSRIKLRSRFNDLCFILIYIFGAIKFLFDLTASRRLRDTSDYVDATNGNELALTMLLTCGAPTATTLRYITTLSYALSLSVSLYVALSDFSAAAA